MVLHHPADRIVKCGMCEDLVHELRKLILEEKDLDLLMDIIRVKMGMLN